MQLGKNIKKHRNALGLTQTQLAEKLGTTQFVITNYERDVRTPSASKVPAIAKALAIPIDSLYGIESKPPKEPRTAANTREKQMQTVFTKLAPADQRAMLKQAKGLID